MSDPRHNQPAASTRDLSTFAGQLERALTGRRAVSFGPGVPLSPTRPEEPGPRRFQYPVGVNQVTSPRGEYPGLTPFAQLQSLAELYDVAAMCIAVRIEEIQGLAWTVAAKDKRRQRELQSVCDELVGRFAVPDGFDEFDSWISSLLYDVFAIDALTIYPKLDLGGRVTAWEPIAGETIKPVVGTGGRTIAYQQVLYGVPFADYARAGGELDAAPIFDRHELIYRPRWRRNKTPYGFPPSEWIILRVNQALRKQGFDLAYFTEGNVPEAFLIPKSGMMTPDQVREFESYFNALVQGDIAARKRITFLPFEADYKESRTFSYDTTLDDWLMRVTCAAYGVPPNELGFTDMVNKASAQVQEAVNERRGLRPITAWLKDLFDRFIPHMSDRPYLPAGAGLFSASRPGSPTREAAALDRLVEFRWVFGEQDDRSAQATTDKIYVEIGAITKEEVRAMRFADELDGPAPVAPPAPAEPPPATPQGAPPTDVPPQPSQFAAGAPVAPEPALKRAGPLTKTGGHDGVIVALWCDGAGVWADDMAFHESLHNLAVAAGLGPYAVPRGDQHLTLVKLGAASLLTPDDRAGIRRVVQDVAAATIAPLGAELGGVVVFPDGEDGTPLAAAVSGQELSAFRERLAAALAAAGHPHQGHGFLPHITMAYLPAAAPRRLPLIGRSPILFGALTLMWGGEREDIPFRAPPGLAKRADDEDQPPDAAERERSERRAAQVFQQALAAQLALLDPALAREPLQTPADFMLWRRLRERAAQAGLPLFEELLAGAARGAGEGLPVAPDWGLVNAEVLALARREADRLADETTETTRAGVVRAVSAWIAAGEDRAALRRRVTDLFDTKRAQLIATTEVTRLYALGNQAAWRASGLVAGLKVKGSADERVCPTCKGHIFSEGGVILPVDAPASSLPPYHPRCRCWAAPVTIPPPDVPASTPTQPRTPATTASSSSPRRMRRDEVSDAA